MDNQQKTDTLRLFDQFVNAIFLMEVESENPAQTTVQRLLEKSPLCLERQDEERASRAVTSSSQLVIEDRFAAVDLNDTLLVQSS